MRSGSRIEAKGAAQAGPHHDAAVRANGQTGLLLSRGIAKQLFPDAAAIGRQGCDQHILATIGHQTGGSGGLHRGHLDQPWGGTARRRGQHSRIRCLGVDVSWACVVRAPLAGEGWGTACAKGVGSGDWPLASQAGTHCHQPCRGRAVPWQQLDDVL